MKIEKIRKDFPIFNIKENSQPVIYFDSACQSLRPQSVIDAINDYYQKFSACEGRSVHKFGEKVTRKCEESRRIIAKFIKAKKEEEIIFTRNTTEGINLVAQSLELQAGDIVALTDKEHNSNLVPWQIKADKENISLLTLPSRADNTFDFEKFEELMNEKVKLVSIVHTSNLDGVTNPIKKIIKIAHKYGAKVLIDGAQSAAHQKINVLDLDVDFMAFSGHKMLGPSGIGFLYGKYDLLKKLKPFIVGGDTVEYSTYDKHQMLLPPKKFEAGLQDYAGIIGLAEAIKYLKKVGFKKIIKQEIALNKFITEEIINLPGLKIIGPQDYRKRGGIISFFIEGIDTHQIALMLDSSANVMVRSGQFCVHSWFADRQIKNAVRISLAFYNTIEEAQILVKSLKKIIKLSY